MLDSIVVKNAEWQARFLVNSLRILTHVSLFLYPFKLSKQKYRSILDWVSLAIFFCLLSFFFDDMSEDSVVNWETVYIIELLDKFEAHGATNSPIPK